MNGQVPFVIPTQIRSSEGPHLRFMFRMRTTRKLSQTGIALIP